MKIYGFNIMSVSLEVYNIPTRTCIAVIPIRVMLLVPPRGTNANVDFWQAIYSHSWKIYDELAGKVAFGCYWRYS